MLDVDGVSDVEGAWEVSEEKKVLDNRGTKKTKPDTRLPKSRVGGLGP